MRVSGATMEIHGAPFDTDHTQPLCVVTLMEFVTAALP